jgi:ribosomal-protein-alanine N-acetyltransferase
MQLAADTGIRYMTLECRRSNLAAQSLYRKLGFQEVGLRKRYYADNGEDALVMVCEHLPEAHPEDDPHILSE